MKIQIPSKCPSCNSVLILANDQLFCRNKSCEAQSLKKIEHFCKSVKLKGFGPATLAKLNFESILDLFTFSLSYYKETLGDKIGQKLYDEVQKAKNHITLNQVIAGLGIPLVGATVASKLSKHITSIDDINEKVCKESGLGDKVTNNLLEYSRSEEYAALKDLLSKFKPTSSKQSNSLTVCITGKLDDFKSRAQAAQYLETLGFTVVDNVTKTTDILINEEDRDSSKLKKAKSLGIMITTIKELEKDI